MYLAPAIWEKIYAGGGKLEPLPVKQKDVIEQCHLKGWMILGQAPKEHKLSPTLKRMEGFCSVIK